MSEAEIVSKVGQLTCPRCVVHQCLPDMNGRLAHDVDSILAGEIERGEYTIAPLDTKDFHQRLARRFCHSSLLGLFVFFDLGFPADTRHLEQQLSHERDG